MDEIMGMAWFAILRDDHRANECSGVGEVTDSGGYLKRICFDE